MRLILAGNLPDVFKTKRRQLHDAAAYFAARSRKRAGNPAWREVTVVFVDDTLSDEIHRAIIGEAGATDVITQAYHSIPPEEKGLTGEIYVNASRALAAAPKRKGWSPVMELLLYIAHGMDHLSGADDHDECGYRRMRRRELGWLRDFSGGRA